MGELEESPCSGSGDGLSPLRSLQHFCALLWPPVRHGHGSGHERGFRSFPGDGQKQRGFGAITNLPSRKTNRQVQAVLGVLPPGA